MRSLCFGGVAAMALIAMAAQSAQFKLTVNRMTLEEARSCPGGYGAFGQFSLAKPEGLKKTPKFTSAHPLYGQLHDGSAGSAASMVFVLDEPKGDGKGYERLYVDVNRNGDLTDDTQFDRLPGGPDRMPPDYEQGSFGPVHLPPGETVGPWRPGFYAEIYLYNKQLIRDFEDPPGQDMRQFPVGQLRLMAASYLGTTVELDGVRQRIGLVDGNCNFKLGDKSQSTTVHRSSNDKGTWYLMPGDFLLRDRDNSGKFERRVDGADAEPFSSLVYVGLKPHRLTLAADLTSLELKPEPGPYGELLVKAEIEELLLGWAPGTSDAYEALTPRIQDGRAWIPAGNVRVATCALRGVRADGSWVRTESRECPDSILPVGPATATSLVLGKPLSLKVTADTRRGVVGMSATSGDDGERGAKTLMINVAIQGAGGESYSGFMQGGGADGQVPPPTFEVLGADGDQVASGKLEYG